MYREYLPDVRLRDLIETYWVADGIVSNPVSQQIMPDGCVDIILNFEENDGNGGLKSGLPAMIGTMTSVLNISYNIGRVQMLGIRFRPVGITAFTRMPLNEITNKNLSLSLADTLFDNEFYECLPEIENMYLRLKHIDQYLISKLPQLLIPEKQIQFAVALIRANHGLISIRQVAEEACLCERHFERKFKSAIGISPKLFSNVIRFQFARHYLKTHKEESLYSVAISCGYHDHSHMNKEFQRLGKTSPSELIR